MTFFGSGPGRTGYKLAIKGTKCTKYGGQRGGSRCRATQGIPAHPERQLMIVRKFFAHGRQEQI